MITNREICSNCGSSLIIADEDGKPYCLLCRRPYNQINKWQDYGRMGGIQTYLRHGREHMIVIGRRGGRPRIRQLSVPLTENKVREGMAAQPTNLKVLRELWREHREELSAASSSSQEA